MALAYWSDHELTRAKSRLLIEKENVTLSYILIGRVDGRLWCVND